MLPGRHPDRAVFLTNLANIVQARGELREALGYHSEASSIWSEFVEPTALRTAESLGNESGIYRRLGCLAAATLAREKALAIVVHDPSGRDVKVPAAYGATGQMHRRIGALRSAVHHHRRALAWEKKIYGGDHWELAGTYDNLGRALRHAGDLEGAVKASDEAIRLKVRVGKTHDEDFAKTLDDLGTAWRFREDLERSLSYHERSLVIRRKISEERPGRESTRCLQYSLTALAVTNLSMGATEDAVEFLTEAADLNVSAGGDPFADAVAACVRSFREPHGDSPAWRRFIGTMYRRIGDLKTAVVHYEVALKQLADQSVHERAQTLACLGRALRHSGRLKEAADRLSQALGLLESFEGHDTQIYADVLDDLGTTLRHRGRFDGSMEHHLNALAVRQRIYAVADPTGDDRRCLRHTLICLGATWRDMEVADQSLSAADEASNHLQEAARLERGSLEVPGWEW